MTSLPKSMARDWDAERLTVETDPGLQALEAQRLASQGSARPPQLPSIGAPAAMPEAQPAATPTEDNTPVDWGQAVPTMADLGYPEQNQAQPMPTGAPAAPGSPSGAPMASGGIPMEGAYNGPSGGPVDHSSREAFIASMLPYAKQAEAQTGIPAEVMMAINLNEQGWQADAPGNNYFGIKGSNPRTGANTGAVNTWEDYGNGRQNIQDTFRAYDSPAESYADFGDFLKSNSRYQPALQQFQQDHDAAALIRNIHAAGYATDPDWSRKINSIAQDIAGQTHGGSAAMLADNAPETQPNSSHSGTIKGGSTIQQAMADPEAQGGVQFDKWGNDGSGSDQLVSNNAANGIPEQQSTDTPSAVSDVLNGATSTPARDDWSTNPGVTPDLGASRDPGAADAPGAGAPSPAPVEQAPQSPVDRFVSGLTDLVKSLIPGGNGGSGSDVQPAATQAPIQDAGDGANAGQGQADQGVDLSRGQRPVMRSAADVPQASGPTRDTYAQEPERGNPDMQIQGLERAQAPEFTKAMDAQSQGINVDDARQAFPQPNDLMQGADNLNQAIAAPANQDLPPSVYGDGRIQRATDLLGTLQASDPGQQVTNLLDQAGVPGHETIGGSIGPIDIGPREMAGALVGGVLTGGLGGEAKAAEDITHVVGMGNKRGITQEMVPIMEGMVKRIKESRGVQDVSREGIATLAHESGLDAAALVKKFDGIDTREGAQVMEVLTRGSSAAINDIMDKAAILRETPESYGMAGDMIDAMHDAAVGTILLDGGPQASIRAQVNAATYASRMLSQLKNAVNVGEAQTWLDSMKTIMSDVNTAGDALMKIAKGQVPREGDLARVERAAGTLERAGKSGHLTEEGDATFQKVRGKLETTELGDSGAKASITAEQVRNLRDLDKNPILDALRKTWDDMSQLRQRSLGDMVDQGLTPNEREMMVEPGDKTGAPLLRDRSLPLEGQVRVREQLKRDIDNKIQQAINRERNAASREDLQGRVTDARKVLDDIIGERMRPSGSTAKGQSQNLADLEDEWNAAVAKVKDHPLGDGPAQILQEAKEKRLNKWVGDYMDRVNKQGAEAEQSAQRDADRFIKGIDESINRHNNLTLDRQRRDQLKGFRDQAKEYLQKLRTDPGNRELRSGFDEVVNNIAMNARGGAPEAVKYYNTQEIQDLSGKIREVVTLARQNPHDPGLGTMANEALVKLGQVNDLGKSRADQMRETLTRRGLERMATKVDKGQLDQFITALKSVDPQKPETLANILKGLRAGSFGDKMIEYAIANMLSSPATHAVNAISNVGQGIGRFGVELPLMAAHDAIANHGKNIPPSSIPAAYEAIGHAWGAGLQAAGETMRAGFAHGDIERAAQLADFRGIRREQLTEKLGPVGAALHMLSTRPLQAADTLFSHMFYAGNLAALAEARAKQLGVPRDEILTNLSDHLDLVKKAGAMTDYSLLKNPSVVGRMLNAGERATKETTGDTGAAIYRNAVHWILPFVTTPENFAKQGVEYSPIGAVVNMGRYVFQRSLQDDPEKQAQVFAHAAAGLGLAAIAGGLYSQHDEHGNSLISGDGPADAGRRDELYSQGWRPRSVKISGNWVSYDNLPVTIPWASFVTAMERGEEASKKAGAKGQDTIMAQAGGLGTGAASALAHQTFLQNVGQMYDALTGGQGSNPQSKASSIVNRYVPASGALAFLARVGDNYQRDTRNVDQRAFGIPNTERMLADTTNRTPGARWMLPPSQDVLGRPQPNDQSVGLIGPRRSQDRSDPVIQSFLDAGVSIPDPPSKIDDITLSKDEQRAYQRYFGQQLQETLGEKLQDPRSSFNRTSDSVKKDLLDSYVDIAQSHAEAMMIREGIGKDAYKQRLRETMGAGQK